MKKLQSLHARYSTPPTQGLAVYLLPKGKVPGIGPETGKVPSNGIGVLRDPFGSVRYLARVNGCTVSALQVMTRDNMHATIANVYTHPAYRRQGWARTLLVKARKDFSTVIHAHEDNLSADAKEWRKKVDT